MKKIFTTILLAASTTFIFGQSTLRILDHKGADITNTTITVKVAKGELNVVELGIKNPTNKTILYKVNRTLVSGPVNEACGAALSFCTGIQCYPPNTDITWTPEDTSSIGAGVTYPNPDTSIKPLKYGITSDYTLCDNECNDLTVLYRVFKVEAGTKDTSYVTIKYSCTVGIKEEKASLGSISEAYPNPTSTEFALNYHINSTAKSEIAIFDVCGKRIKEAKLVDREGTVKIGTAQFVPGIYFYSLIVNNQTVTTKKLIVEGF